MDSETVGGAEEPLFGSDRDWWHNACVNWTSYRWDAYASGYKEAADLLVERLSDSHGTLDTVVYPLLFLYRQYLELRLKDLVRGGRRLLDRDAPKKLDHRLLPLWRELRSMVEQLWPKEDSKPLDEIEEYLSQFSEVDPESFAFRYPESKKGDPAFQGLTHINIRRVGEIMNGISKLLEGVGCALSEYLQHKADMESEMRGC